MITLKDLEKIKTSQRALNSLRFAEKTELKPLQPTEILICSSTGCSSCGSDKIIEALKSIESSGRKEGAVIDSTLEKYKEKKADNPLNNQGLSTFSGGGEGN